MPVDADGREHRDVEETGPSDEKLARVRHGAEVGADIDRVGDEQQRHDDLQQPVRIVPAEIAGDAMPRGAAEAGADLLDRHHQRIGQQHGPADAEAELRTGLAVGADAGRIVVRRAGDQPWPENADKAPDGTGFDRLILFSLQCCHAVRHSQRLHAAEARTQRRPWSYVPRAAMSRLSGSRQRRTGSGPRG